MPHTVDKEITHLYVNHLLTRPPCIFKERSIIKKTLQLNFARNAEAVKESTLSVKNFKRSIEIWKQAVFRDPVKTRHRSSAGATIQMLAPKHTRARQLKRRFVKRWLDFSWTRFILKRR